MANRPSVVYQPGPEGEPGKRGPQGKSAFELARDRGYTGSLEQWLASLKGARGDRGLPGERGKDGAPGAPALPPQLPQRADFERDPFTKLTERVLVTFAFGFVEVVPQRDDEGLMVAASFAQV